MNRSVVTRCALAAVVMVFAGLSLAVALLNPAWEADDEPSHVLNVETLVAGHWYEMHAGAGYEPQQPPLYYLFLAGWQEVLQTPARRPAPVGSSFGFRCNPNWCQLYRHDVPQETSDRHFLARLRIPNVVGGVVVLLLTAAIARRLSRDPWTPVVAAAVVAGVPKFVFNSAAVNNDNLVNVLGAALLLGAVVLVDRAPQRTRDGWPLAALLGATVGLLLLAKLTGAVLAPVVVVAVLLCTRRAAVRLGFLILAALSALAVSGWWLILNVQRYGDPFALTWTKSYLRGGHGGVLFGLGFPRHYGAARILFADVPRVLYRTFWYDSNWGRLPMWIALVAALAGLVVSTTHTPKRNVAHLLVLGTCVAAALLSVGLAALQTSTFRASYTYGGLAALACLAALGLERLPIPVAARFTGPALGLIITLAAIQHDVIDFYHR